MHALCRGLQKEILLYLYDQLNIILVAHLKVYGCGSLSVFGVATDNSIQPYLLVAVISYWSFNRLGFLYSKEHLQACERRLS